MAFKLGITMLIHDKDDILFVTEFPCFQGHPVYIYMYINEKTCFKCTGLPKKTLILRQEFYHFMSVRHIRHILHNPLCTNLNINMSQFMYIYYTIYLTNRN